MRLEMVTGFGAPAFILVARGGRATLLVPGERRIVTDAPPEDVLGALTGVPLAPADLLAMLTGCVEPDARAAGGRTHGNGWVSVDLTGGSTVYLVHPRPESPEWRARAARRGAWRIEYPDWPDGSPFPASVRLFSTMPIAVRLEAHLSQVETSAGIDDEAFSVRANGAQPMTLDELKANGPLRGK